MRYCCSSRNKIQHDLRHPSLRVEVLADGISLSQCLLDRILEVGGFWVRHWFLKLVHASALFLCEWIAMHVLMIVSFTISFLHLVIDRILV